MWSVRTGLALAAVAVGSLFGIPAAAQAEQAPPTPISSCTAVSSPGSYVLTGDLASSGGICLSVLAPDVAIDLQGYVVTGPAVGTGIKIWQPAARVTVANGTVSEFSVGVESDALSTTLSSLTVRNNRVAGIVLHESAYSTVTGNQLADNRWMGLFLQDTDHTAVFASTIDGSGIYGMAVQGSSQNVIAGNTISGSSVAGLYLGCFISRITYSGDCQDSVGNTIEQNTLSDNGSLGIALDLGSDGNRITANTASGSTSFDLFDANPGCAANQWSTDQFLTLNQACVG